jgi:uncharacterized protein
LKTIFILAGLLCIALGVLGIFTPILPTTPFLLLATYFFSKSSEKLHLWLTHHPRLGPIILAWETSRSIPMRAKIIATITLAISLVLILSKPIVIYAKLLGVFSLIGAGLFILTRPTTKSK